MRTRPRHCLAPDGEGTPSTGTPPANNPPKDPEPKGKGQEKLLNDQVARHDVDLTVIKKKLGLDAPPPATSTTAKAHACSSPFCDGVGGCIDELFAEETPAAAAPAPGAAK